MTYSTVYAPNHYETNLFLLTYPVMNSLFVLYDYMINLGASST